MHQHARIAHPVRRSITGPLMAVCLLMTALVLMHGSALCFTHDFCNQLGIPFGRLSSFYKHTILYHAACCVLIPISLCLLAAHILIRAALKVT